MRINAIADDKMVLTLAASAGVHGDRHVRRRNWNVAAQALETLSDLGFAVPANIKAAAASKAPIAPFAVALHELDAKLRHSNLNTSARMELKTALGHHNLIKVPA